MKWIKCVIIVIESTSVDPTELQNFYEKNFPTLFRVYEESIQFFDKTAKESKKRNACKLY